MLVVMRIYGWSYEQTEYYVKDSLVLRQFCRVYLEPVPDDTTLIRWANTLGPEMIRKLNDRVVKLARRKKITRGRKLRVDTTAVETNIHFPTNNGLIDGGARVVSRLLRNLLQDGERENIDQRVARVEVELPEELRVRNPREHQTSRDFPGRKARLLT